MLPREMYYKFGLDESRREMCKARTRNFYKNNREKYENYRANTKLKRVEYDRSRWEKRKSGNWIGRKLAICDVS